MGLSIGPIAVDPPVVLAPMAGVTNSAFRRLCRSFGAGLYVSEMVSARAIVEGNEKSTTRTSFAPDEPVRSLQLYAVDPAVVSTAVRMVVADGVQHVDLNMGCPSPKVMRRGGGAALPVHTRLVAAIVREAVRAADGVPVTVKTRVGVDDDTITFLDTGRAAEDEGAAAIALHARTAEQLYSGRADWDRIGELKQAVTSIPVLGNGDIWDGRDALAMLAQTGCDGVVVGRGCLGKPWLFRELADVFAGREVLPQPPLGEVCDIMRRHARLLVEAFGDEPWAMRDFRKHVGWYLTGYPAGGANRRALGMVASLAELDELLERLDPTATLPPGSERLPRGHLAGPKQVSLPEGWRESRSSLLPPDELFVTGG